VTEVLRVDPQTPDQKSIARAAECLRSGGLVAFPTETVYGLGAHALDRAAVRRVFAAKERPVSDPLIIHVASFDAVIPLVAEVPTIGRDLATRFWPGPLTLILRRSDRIPDEVTAGLDTVALRVPAHPVAHALIQCAGLPVAAPSANRFSRPSPTRAAHVLADLDRRIDMILDAGPTTVGVESTVIDLTRKPPMVLRPGAIDVAALRSVVPDVGTRSIASVEGTGGMPSPGMLPKHYAPATPLRLFEGSRTDALAELMRTAQRHVESGESVAVLAFAEDIEPLSTLPIRLVSFGSERDPIAIAARLYAALREGDELGTNIILVRNITTEHPLTAAIQDRLRRAATSPFPLPPSP
jgi:L-threonylcarbamoyladenylate synthase